MDLNHKKRWVLSPFTDGKPLVAEYSIGYNFPVGPVDGKALVHCVMNAHQLSAARKDPRLIVLGSIHSSDEVHEDVVSHHKAYGVNKGMRLHDMLVALAKVHHYFEPEH